MTPWICRTLMLLSRNASQCLRKPPSLHSISLLFFSTSRSTVSKPKITIFDYFVPQKLQNADSVLNFLMESGFSKTQIENVVQRPKINIFQDLGFNTIDFADIVSGDPWILYRSADNSLGPSILVLKNVGAVWFLKHDSERTMIPNIEYIKSCGVSYSQIVKFLFTFPRLFLIKPDNMKDFVRRVDEMGVDRKSKVFLPAIRVMSSITEENWDHKLKLLRELGFSEENILSVFRRVPQALGVFERKIKEVIQLLRSVENRDISCIICHPELLRLLRSWKLLKKKPSLSATCKITNAQFLRKYVIPYSNEVGDLYMANHGS
ncbi:hypothetical protein P3X46_028688 [Hevea brasiliensis]|uniref:Uncharacterized protein n=1 Tax=Hevea brasiliensis TaxID=3981 RepID=A0ABQ9KRQ0_HEVBR|nr:hypothetical protein P3X46_028688 [Hevea brasiliensis]